MPSLTLPDRLIWFAHCPKAGGTSVEKFLVARWGDKVGHLHWGWDRWWRRGGWRVADPPNSPQHLIWADAAVRLPKPPDAIFAVVRDPVSRMASEYRWQRTGHCQRPLGKLLAHLPFSVWLRLMLAVAKRAPYAFDNHLRPQADFIPETAQVFRLEDGLEPVVRWLAETTSEVIAEGRFPHAIATGPDHRIAPADRALIAQVFAEDYARFGYAPVMARPKAGLIDGLAVCLAPLVAVLDRTGQL